MEIHCKIIASKEKGKHFVIKSKKNWKSDISYMIFKFKDQLLGISYKNLKKKMKREYKKALKPLNLKFH